MPCIVERAWDYVLSDAVDLSVPGVGTVSREAGSDAFGLRCSRRFLGLPVWELAFTIAPRGPTSVVVRERASSPWPVRLAASVAVLVWSPVLVVVVLGLPDAVEGASAARFLFVPLTLAALAATYSLVKSLNKDCHERAMSIIVAISGREPMASLSPDTLGAPLCPLGWWLRSLLGLAVVPGLISLYWWAQWWIWPAVAVLALLTCVMDFSRSAAVQFGGHLPQNVVLYHFNAPFVMNAAVVMSWIAGGFIAAILLSRAPLPLGLTEPFELSGLDADLGDPFLDHPDERADFWALTRSSRASFKASEEVSIQALAEVQGITCEDSACRQTVRWISIGPISALPVAFVVLATAVAWFEFVRWPRRWSRSVERAFVSSLAISRPAGATAVWLARVNLAIQWAALSALAAMSSLLALGLVASMVTPIVPPWIVAPFAWIVAITQELIGEQRFGREVGVALALIAVSPGLGLPTLTFVGTWHAEREVRRLRHLTLADDPVSRAELEANGTVRGVRLVRSEAGVMPTTSWALFGPAVISVPDEFTRRLSAEERRLVLRHELGHVVHDARRTRLLAALSLPTMIARPLLAGSVDARVQELRADRFAVRSLEEAHVLMRGLATLSLLGSLVPQESAGNVTGRSAFREIWDFYFGRSLVGYVHPDLAIRSEALGIRPEAHLAGVAE